MNVKSDRLEEFEDILKQYDQELHMYFSPKKEVKMGDIDPKELFSKVSQWSKLSKQGLICGIMGCSADPKNECSICCSHYCPEHIPWHFHSASNTGILEKDSSEMR